MTMSLYWASGSPNAWRVLLALEVLRLSFESNFIELSKRQHKTPDFLAMNPRGKVPVLRDGDLVLYESLAILAYLDRVSNGALYGKTPREVATTSRIINEFECYLREPLAVVLRHLLAIGGAPPTALTPTPQQAETASETVRAELRALSQRMEGAQWLAGDRFSAADAAVYPYLRLLARAISKADGRARELSLSPFFDAFPGLTGWFARIEQLPGYDRTYPPHWRTADGQ